MSVLTALRLELANNPGELAKALHAIAQANVNIHAVAGVATGQSSVIELLPNNVIAATSALQQIGYQPREVEVAVTWVPNRPGTLLQACEAIAAAGINIDAVYVVATDPTLGVQLTFEARDAQRVDQILGSVEY
ncbi:MAG TPA: ACT domain-containing protein [Ktedonobacterales bacterium]